MPAPLQCGQVTWLISWMLDFLRWRDSSIIPNLEMREIWVRARSRLRAFLKVFSISAMCLRSFMSMKSMTMSPPRSRSLSCRAISSAASRLARKAVSSTSRRSEALPELTSIVIIASVGLMMR
ncbi:MAG: hypothetical protein A4E67_00930 [Syntrophaceae bacterium PtaB.Bin038]|nr:MAG: hypothetical protein A4E67_00930 [Syntrophaceae bacterium PtaB.Bin038]